MLAEAPPAPGFGGFVRFSRGVSGRTFGDSCRAAGETRPDQDTMSAEAWTTPRSVRAAGKIVLHGKGNRLDLQDTHSSAECSVGLATMLKMQSRVASHAAGAGGPQGGRARKPIAMHRSPRVNPALLGPAGSPSISGKLDAVRQDEYRKEKFLAIRNNDIPSAIRR